MQCAPALQSKTADKRRYSFPTVLALVLLSFCLIACDLASGCGATNLNSTCQTPSRRTPVSSLTPTVPVKLTPTAIPTFVPTPTPTVGGAPSQAPTAFPELTDQEVATNTTHHYVVLVVVDGTYRKAYNLLSADLQASEPYNDFIQNLNYTLKKGCWTTGAMHVSQRDSLTWDVGVELTQVSCVDTTPIAHFDWHFQVQKENGLFVITSVGLYPTGSQNQ